MSDVYFGGAIIIVGRILVIELNQELATEIRLALEEAGYTVVRTDDTRDGFRQLYQAYPHLTILERELPIANGKDSFPRIRYN